MTADILASALIATLAAAPASGDWSLADHARVLAARHVAEARAMELQAQVLGALYPSLEDAQETAASLRFGAAWRRERAAGLASSHAEDGND